MLITNAELVALDRQAGAGVKHADIRIENSRIKTIGRLEAFPGETVIEAGGNAVLPGLHDHHVHFLSYAASLASVRCGPPDVFTARELQSALALVPDDGWLRGYGYHESVAGEIDREWLDRHGPDRPVRIQHRTGRLWIVNSTGLSQIRAGAREQLTVEQGRRLDAADGRLFDVDELLRQVIPTDLSMVESASTKLAAFGVTGFNDMTPANSPDTVELFKQLMRDGHLMQSVRMSGMPALSDIESGGGVEIGSTKVHLHEAALPDFGELRALIAESHIRSRAVAIHCVTEAELVFALAALRDAHVAPGDRIEHASVTPPALLEQLKELELIVVTQPGFVFERGDAYLRDMPADELDWLYRAKAFVAAGIPLAFATDTPFGAADPWQAMHSATTRETAQGCLLGKEERLTPELAVGAFLGALDDPSRPRTIVCDEDADLCLLDRTWRDVRRHLSEVHVRATIKSGTLIYNTDSMG